MNELIAKITQLIEQLRTLVATDNLPTPQGQRILTAAVSFIGVDASPADIASDELGCAETVSNVVNGAGFQIPTFVSTARLYEHLKGTREWVAVLSALPGDVIISPTGMGGRNGIKNGHVGIVGEGEAVMSNDSLTGTFLANYTLSSWSDRYSARGGYPVFFFRRIL